MPRFSLDSTVDGVKVLQALGVEDLFVEGSADLSGVDGTKELYVSTVAHKVKFASECPLCDTGSNKASVI